MLTSALAGGRVFVSHDNIAHRVVCVNTSRQSPKQIVAARHHELTGRHKRHHVVLGTGHGVLNLGRCVLRMFQAEQRLSFIKLGRQILHMLFSLVNEYDLGILQIHLFLPRSEKSSPSQASWRSHGLVLSQMLRGRTLGTLS